ncbi:MBL fold metallo-hydrolase [Halobacteriovorax sp. HFRX-2_2]|uniref:MBL fold metallo-hydrolase n=1 Tax=unclassified Halobacteriovorax TaxID=2639665 RepID=UPI00371C4CA5
MSYKIHELKGYIQTIYIVEENGSLLLLDGCCRPDVELVKDFIEKDLGKPFSSLKLVISTHAHPDHVGGLSYFKGLGVAVAGPCGLNDWYKGISGFFTYCVDIFLTYMVAVNKKRGFKNVLFPRHTELDLVLSEGMNIPGFESWQILETSGHTDIDLTIYHPSTKLAYVADNFIDSPKFTARPYPLFNPSEYKKSLKRYIDMGISDFLIAHYGRVKIPKERIQKLIDSTPLRPRRHLRTLPSILLMLVRTAIRKITRPS